MLLDQTANCPFASCRRFSVERLGGPHRAKNEEHLGSAINITPAEVCCGALHRHGCFKSSPSVLEHARHGSQWRAALGAAARWLRRSHERTSAPCAHAAVRAREQDPQVFGRDAVQADAALAPRGRHCRCSQGLLHGTWFEVWGSKLRLQSGGHRFTLSSRRRRRAAALHGLRGRSCYSVPLHPWHASDSVPGRLFEAARTHGLQQSHRLHPPPVPPTV